MDIQRRVELAIANYLSAQIPGGRFVAAEDDANTEPPYTVVAVDDESSRMTDEYASALVVDVIYVTHILHAAAAEHSAAAAEIRRVLATMPRGFHANESASNAGVMIHGIDIMSSVRVTDDGNARGHAVTLQVGAGILM